MEFGKNVDKKVIELSKSDMDNPYEELVPKEYLILNAERHYEKEPL